MTTDEQPIIRQLQEARRRLDLMRVAGDELARVSSLSQKLQNILRLLHEQFFINYSMILLPDEEGKFLVVHCSHGYEDNRKGFKIEMGMGIAGLAASKKMPINITGLERKRKYVLRTAEPPAQPSATLPGLAEPESQIAIPLVVNEELVAVLLAESYNVCVFSREDEAFLITLSQSIAVSIQNARLFDSMEAMIARRTAELQKSNETKNRLFSLISHDLRGPITSFHNLALLVSSYNKKNEKEKIEQLSQRVDQSVHRLNSLLDNLLNWALAQTGTLQCRPEKLLLADVVQEVMDLFTDQALQKEIRVRVENETGLFVLADLNMLRAILRNIVANALKYTTRGKEIHIRNFKKDNRVHILVRDEGIGISQERLPMIFEPDERKSTEGTEKEKGTGLGLMVAKEFVRMNNGTITLISQPGQGTVAEIILPAT
jgi:signal transduction histidine kinase